MFSSWLDIKGWSEGETSTGGASPNPTTCEMGIDLPLIWTTTLVAFQTRSSGDYA